MAKTLMLAVMQNQPPLPPALLAVLFCLLYDLKDLQMIQPNVIHAFGLLWNNKLELLECLEYEAIATFQRVIRVFQQIFSF